MFVASGGHFIDEFCVYDAGLLEDVIYGEDFRIVDGDAEYLRNGVGLLVWFFGPVHLPEDGAFGNVEVEDIAPLVDDGQCAPRRRLRDPLDDFAPQ